MKIILFSLGLSLAFSFASPASAQEAAVLASFPTDFSTVLEDQQPERPDASETGVWRIGFGSAFTPWKNFKTAAWGDDVFGFGSPQQFFRFGDSSRAEAVILPGLKRSYDAAVIQWEAKVAAFVRLRGKIALLGQSPDGVRFSLFHNEKKIWDGATCVIPPQVRNIAADEGIEIGVAAGDRLWLVIDPAGETNTGDEVRFVEPFVIESTTPSK